MTVMDNGTPSSECVCTSFDELKKRFDHIAWVPVVMGRLNYNRVCVPDLPESKLKRKGARSDVAMFKQRTRDERELLVSSVVDWKDRKDAKADGEFRVVMAAEVLDTADEDKCLSGSVYIYPHKLSGDPTSEKFSSFKNGFITKIEKLNEYNNELEDINLNRIYLEDQCNGIDKRANANILINEVKEYLNDLSLSEYECYKINFITKKNGLTYLKFDDISEKYDEVTVEVVLRQAFYYIKYCLHTHKHHPQQEDSITTTHSIGSSKEVGLELLDELQKAIVDLKVYLHANRASNHQVEGVVSYCKALVNILEHEKMLKSDEIDRRQFLLTNYLKSANAISKRISSDTEGLNSISKKWNDFWTSARQGYTLCLALLTLAFLFYFNSYDQKQIDLDMTTAFVLVAPDLRSFVLSFYQWLIPSVFLCYTIYLLRTSMIIFFDSRAYKLRLKALEKRSSQPTFNFQAYMARSNVILKAVKVSAGMTGAFAIIYILSGKFI